MSEINCPRSMDEMLWTRERLRWECGCGKTIAVTVVAKHSADPLDHDPQPAHETDPGSLSDSMQGVVRLARGQAVASIRRTRQWIH